MMKSNLNYPERPPPGSEIIIVNNFGEFETAMANDDQSAGTSGFGIDHHNYNAVDYYEFWAYEDNWVEPQVGGRVVYGDLYEKSGTIDEISYADNLVSIIGGNCDDETLEILEFALNDSKSWKLIDES